MGKNKIEVRKSTEQDLETMLAIFARARKFMAENGNPTQWAQNKWPPEDLLKQDIAEGISYVCLNEGKVVGTFVFIQGKDIEPTYSEIEDGAWLDDSPYGVIHRIASDGTVKGLGEFCINWGLERCGHHMRLDTHPDNKIAQNLLEKCGFTKCGIIHVTQDPYPRIAYEMLP